MVLVAFSPVMSQRIMKYPMLLEALHKATPDGHPDKVALLSTMENMTVRFHHGAYPGRTQPALPSISYNGRAHQCHHLHRHYHNHNHHLLHLHLHLHLHRLRLLHLLHLLRHPHYTKPSMPAMLAILSYLPVPAYPVCILLATPCSRSIRRFQIDGGESHPSADFGRGGV